MKKNIILIISLLFVFTNSCDFTRLDLNDDPNNLKADDADITMILSGVELNFKDLFAGYYADGNNGLNIPCMRITRMLHQFGAYTGPFSDVRSTSLNSVWDWTYASILKNGKLVVKLADTQEGYEYHSGIAKVLMAYTLTTMVDVFGDIPYTETGDPNNFNPKLDESESVYAAAFLMLDEAITDFEKTPAVLPVDFFYNGDGSKWIKLINTLKLKMFLNKRLIDPEGSTSGINDIITSGNYISSTEDDFQFNFSTISANPDSRHPDFIDNYGAGGAGSYFMNNYYMTLLKDEKSAWDPRLRYYIYRQIDEDPTGDDLPCSTSSIPYDYCYIGDYYWGRDHGDDDGVPNDNLKRATWGVYPIGGAFDDNTFQSVPDNQGGGGAGMLPLMLSSYVNFMLAESSLTLSTNGDAKTYLINGIQQSMDKVIAFGAAQADGTGFEASSSDVSDYISEVDGIYDAAANKLDVVAKEYYLALWGNGIETYNLIRRTQLPSDLELPVISIGQFPRTFMYPGNAVDRNSNINQKQVTEPVFWDNHSSNIQ